MKSNKPNTWVKGMALIAALSIPTGCGTNPVTKKSEVQFVSEQTEMSMGNDYVPARQSQGGDYILDPELTAYVQGVGQRVATVSDRKLPYEFVIINSSVPNAWAMPGGKIAVNRGLLYELGSEAELAAVLSHEVVHAAARHGAKSAERGMMLQAAVLAVGLAGAGSDYASLLVGGGQLSAQLIASKYGREDELESDLYGMQYMKKAGYDPRAAVELQKTFVRLNQEHNPGFLNGLFASHPPSEERVAANKATATQLGDGGDDGGDIYAQKVAMLKASMPAYKAYDSGVAALAGGNAAKAESYARKAIAIEPREARFHELLGDVALSKNKPKEAQDYYQKAIKLQPDYFKPYVQIGVALYNSNQPDEAVPYVEKANNLLPTAPGHYILADLAEKRGDTAAAMTHYQIAAESGSEIGKTSQIRFTRLDMPQHPQRYLRANIQLDKKGNLQVILQNASPVPVGKVVYKVMNSGGKLLKVAEDTGWQTYSGVIAPGATVQVKAGLPKPKKEKDLKHYSVAVQSAAIK